MKAETMTGTVKMWNERGGYGFIENPNGGGDIYVHASEINTRQSGRKSLSVGDLVQFEMGQGRKGPCARDVVPAN